MVTPAPTLGPLVCRWIEQNVVLGEGDHYGKPFRLRRWQKRHLWELFELWPKDPEARSLDPSVWQAERLDLERRYLEALFGMPKGNGKTPLGGAVGSSELGGPVVFGGWSEDGRVRGMLRPSPVVIVGAAADKQADLVFGEIKTTWRESQRLAGFADVFEAEVQLLGRPGVARRVAAVRGANDGERPSCFIADELHEWRTGAQTGAYLVMSNGTAKRADSLRYAITTAGDDLDTLLGKLYLRGKAKVAAVAKGEPDPDPRFLFEWHEAAENVDTSTDEALAAAIRSCHPAADDFVNVERVVRQYRSVAEHEGRRYFLNQWTRPADSWLPVGAWDACAGEVVFEPERPTAVGVDFALKRDRVAVVAAQEDEDGVVQLRARVWEPDGGKYDVGEVEQYLRDLHRELEVVAFAYDPAYFERSAQALEDEGLPMLEFPQSRERMVPACSTAYEAVVNRRVRHDGDAALKDHVESAVPRSADRGWTLSKGRSKRPIDACIAFVIARWVATAPLEPAEDLPPADIL